jgi:hypothetical protein
VESEGGGRKSSDIIKVLNKNPLLIFMMPLTMDQQGGQPKVVVACLEQERDWNIKAFAWADIKV